LEETKLKLSMYCGPLASNWKGGISANPYPLIWIDRKFTAYIKKRDGHKCQNTLCKGTSNRLARHHIDGNKQNCELWNVILICISCNTIAEGRKKGGHSREWWENHYSEIMNRRGYGRKRHAG